MTGNVKFLSIYELVRVRQGVVQWYIRALLAWPSRQAQNIYSNTQSCQQISAWPSRPKINTNLNSLSSLKQKVLWPFLFRSNGAQCFGASCCNSSLAYAFCVGIGARGDLPTCQTLCSPFWISPKMEQTSRMVFSRCRRRFVVWNRFSHSK